MITLPRGVSETPEKGLRKALENFTPVLLYQGDHLMSPRIPTATGFVARDQDGRWIRPKWDEKRRIFVSDCAFKPRTDVGVGPEEDKVFPLYQKLIGVVGSNMYLLQPDGTDKLFFAHQRTIKVKEDGKKIRKAEPIQIFKTVAHPHGDIIVESPMGIQYLTYTRLFGPRLKTLVAPKKPLSWEPVDDLEVRMEKDLPIAVIYRIGNRFYKNGVLIYEHPLNQEWNSEWKWQAFANGIAKVYADGNIIFHNNHRPQPEVLFEDLDQSAGDQALFLAHSHLVVFKKKARKILIGRRVKDARGVPTTNPQEMYHLSLLLGRCESIDTHPLGFYGKIVHLDDFQEECWGVVVK